ncbi:MAG: hypothetical protein ACXWJW_04310 [Xanthobacteraceae bacterium]
MRAVRIGLISVVALGFISSAAFAGDGSVKLHGQYLAQTFNAPGTNVTINPQPLPPKEGHQFLSPGTNVTINPQPLPPKEGHQFLTFGSEVMLNPQPLPPKVIGAGLLDTDPVLRTNGPAPTGTPIPTWSR